MSTVDLAFSDTNSKDITKSLPVSGNNSVPTPAPKKMCCACPQTKKVRDECIALYGEDGCLNYIEAHKICLRNEGFNV